MDLPHFVIPSFLVTVTHKAIKNCLFLKLNAAHTGERVSPTGLTVTVQNQQYKAHGLHKQLFESLEEEGSILSREAKGLKGMSRNLSERAKEKIVDSRHIISLSA